MNKYYFTFGSGQVNEGFCQPIIAKDMIIARQKMHDLYGQEWAFCYTEEQWAEPLPYGMPKEIELAEIYVGGN